MPIALAYSLPSSRHVHAVNDVSRLQSLCVTDYMSDYMIHDSCYIYPVREDVVRVFYTNSHLRYKRFHYVSSK